MGKNCETKPKETLIFILDIFFRRIACKMLREIGNKNKKDEFSERGKCVLGNEKIET